MATKKIPRREVGDTTSKTVNSAPIEVKPGRKPDAGPKKQKATITLYETNYLFLDGLIPKLKERADMDDRGGIDRSMIIRSMVQALQKSKLDISETPKETDLTAMFKACFNS